MVNSLTPVLQRRKTGGRGHRGSTPGDVHSAITTPSDSKDLQQLLANFALAGEDVAEIFTKKEVKNENSSLFINPKFARTWHGPIQTGIFFCCRIID